MKLQQFQQNIGGLEIDQIAEFAFFLGDLNYRLETTFADLNNTNVKQEAIAMVPTKDQLNISRGQGNFPNYIEPAINFLPSYKMSGEIDSYIDKKN